MKRRKTIRAGRLVWDITYTVPRPNANKQERTRIREVTEEQVARTNANTAQRKLEMLMATNFDEGDLVLTVTYRDADLPDSADVTRKHLGKVFAQMRAYRKARGLPDLKYIYVLEGRHGDHRPHAHIIINAAGGDLELMRSLWIWGDDIQLNYIRERGYDGWAGYLTKERREASLNGKKQFVGPELRGKTIGVIGLGAIGARVANAAVALGMEVLGYDPYISIDAAWSLSRSVQHCVTLGDMLPRCDYLTIHVPYLPSTKNTINAQTLAMCKDGVRVLNFARGELVDNFALLDALGTGKVAQYFCDFPAEELLGVKGVYCTPHLGASTPESETNCAVMAANELSDYLKNGNITHSVNLPDVSQPRVGGKRICIIHRNEPGAISAITGILTAANLNIENMVNKGRKNVAYTMLDVTGSVDAGLTAQLSGIDAAIRVRIL